MDVKSSYDAPIGAFQSGALNGYDICNLSSPVRVGSNYGHQKFA
jgi:hypothetical protein